MMVETGMKARMKNPWRWVWMKRERRKTNYDVGKKKLTQVV